MKDNDEGTRRASKLWRQPRRWWLLGVPLGGVLMFGFGALALGAFNWTMEMTNTPQFCISCHEMREFVYAEYQETHHYKNRVGVRATCANCHVPKAWGPKVVRKVKATLVEVPNHLLGSIATEEKFEAKRLVLAERVWKEMKANDSRECRACHSYEAMDLAKQDRSARRRHAPEYLERTGETCIDCHKGVAHKLPEMAAAE
jgi:cytochrome c-type protein NapC